MTDEKLVEMALNAGKNAYAPYSDFHVGAALLTENGEVFTGCNVECASFGAGCCAERAAIVSAVSAGKRKFTAIAVAGSGNEICVPCGICRQLLYEFAPDIKVICANRDKKYEIFTLKELLPHAFASFNE